MTSLYIVAAGNGSRMGGNVPKALVPITEDPNLTTTLKQLANKFEHVFVVTNEIIQDQWNDYFDLISPTFTNVKNVPISSGLGDGHAVLQALGATKSIEIANDDMIVCWGDVFIRHAEIVDEMMTKSCNNSGLIPAVMEDEPYVCLLVDQKMQCMSADFSKHGEKHPSGFHDQSIFRFRRYNLWNALTNLHASLWKNGRYITPGGELSLLHTFHYLFNHGDPVTIYQTDYPTLSFNTPQEVAAIQLEINANWQSTNKGTTP